MNPVCIVSLWKVQPSKDAQSICQVLYISKQQLIVSTQNDGKTSLRVLGLRYKKMTGIDRLPFSSAKLDKLILSLQKVFDEKQT